MRICGVVIAFVFACSVTAHAQGTATPAPAASGAHGTTLEGVTMGAPMQQVRDTMGDPVQIVSGPGQQLWRYIERGGSVYVDVLVKNNVAYSVTVVRRFKDSPYTDGAGIAFGSSAKDVSAKLGDAKRTSTNADDGSVDLWYVDENGARIYEFYGDKLGFIQILPSPKLQATFAAAPAVLPGDGTSLATAIRIRPSSLLGNTSWIDAYLLMNQCGSKGHWKQTSSKMSADDAAKDPLAYVTVHAQCTDGGAERDFVFDTHGMITKTGPGGSQNTIYIDASQLRQQAAPAPSGSASPSPNPRRAPARNQNSLALALPASLHR
jgi:hypothetical protein